MSEKRKPGRPRGASSERLSSGKRGARLTLTIDGESVRRRVQLETTDPAVAEIKIEKLQSAEHAAPPAPSTDTFREVARVVFAERAARGVKRVDIELGRVEGHVYPFVGKLRDEPFGDRAVASITADEVLELLAAKRDEGYGYGHVNKMRQAVKYVLDHAKRPGLAARMPPFSAALKKARAVASDEVLLAYLRWEHPVERFRAGVRMRQAMSAVSRCIGGQRTNDLHEATWEDNLQVPETGEPSFEEVWVPRTKKLAPQLLVTPEGVRPMLRLWWQWSGRPRRGPVFPLLRGERVGEARTTQDSHAEALRRDLRRALGIEVWDPGVGAGERGPQGRWRPGRAPTAKERLLFEEGRYTLPVDFHSWRRAWSQALKRAGVNVQTAAALTGHASDLRAHARYLEAPTEAAVVPAGAVPELLPPRGNGGVASVGEENAGETGFGRAAANIGQEASKNMNDSGAPGAIRTLDPWLRRPSHEQFSSGFPHSEGSPPHPENHEERPRENDGGQNPRPQLGDPDELLRLTVSAMMAAGDIDAATALLDVARRRKAPLPDNVHPLSPSARKGGKS